MTDMIEKAMSFEDYLDKVHLAFMESEYDVYPVKTYMNSVIAGGTDGYYLIPVTMDENDNVVIASKDKWVGVEQTWVTKQLGAKDIEKTDERVGVEDTTDSRPPQDNSDDTPDGTPETDVLKEWSVNLIEKNDEKQIAYGVVYGPRSTPDTQNDLMDAEEVERMAHSFLARKIAGQQEAIDLQHQVTVSLKDAIPVESYVAPQDFNINGYDVHKGDWVLATYIPDTEMWNMVKSGEVKAYSIRGYGKRIPT